jgi:hypothetical protein
MTGLAPKVIVGWIDTVCVGLVRVHDHTTDRVTCLVPNRAFYPHRIARFILRGNPRTPPKRFRKTLEDGLATFAR